MINVEYVLLMARYNAWQNKQISPTVEAMDEAMLTQDRGAFFGSIQGTLNHILFGDMIWMSRLCADFVAPAVDGAQSEDTCTTIGEWSAERVRLDDRIRQWAQTLQDGDLKGDLSWYSGSIGRDVVTPRALCVVHMFNHQTHHRGQVHAMLTAVGAAAPTSDLVFMPEDF